MTTVEQLIPNAKEKDHPRETCIGLECICLYTYYVFPIPLPRMLETRLVSTLQYVVAQLLQFCISLKKSFE